MNPIEFENKLNVKVTPNQANQIMHKIEDKILELKKSSSNKYKDLTTFTIKKIDIIDTDISSLLNKIENEFIERFKDKKLLLECQTDLLNVKEALFKFNATNHISKKLSKVEILKHKIEYYKNFKECLICEKNTKKVLIKAKNFLENSNNKKIDIKIIFYDIEEINRLLREVNKEILKLEKEIAYINISNEINILISKNVAELVGLNKH